MRNYDEFGKMKPSLSNQRSFLATAIGLKKKMHQQARCEERSSIFSGSVKSHCPVTCNLVTGETCIPSNSDMYFSVELEREGQMVHVWKKCVPWIEKQNCEGKCTKPGILETCPLACMCIGNE